MGISILYEFKSLRKRVILEHKSPSPTGVGLCEISLLIPARNASSTLENTLQKAHAFLTRHYPGVGQFEIILIPNPAPSQNGNEQDPTNVLSKTLSQKYPSVRSIPHLCPPNPPGKGAAIRTGFMHAQGAFILFTDSDLPYDLDFFIDAVNSLKSGYDFVTGNRRLSTSTFEIPVRLLPLAYGRHRLGLGYNHLVRTLLPIRTTDTQAGIKALSRRLVQKVIDRQACPGFLFDLEIFLTASGEGYHHTEFPVTLHLNTEKSTVRVLRECILVAFWLTRITWRNIMKSYGNAKNLNRTILGKFKKALAETTSTKSSFGTRFGTRAFLTARWYLTPYSRMISQLPRNGLILDLGCGHGLFSIAAALSSPTRTLIGIDHDTHRVHLASHAARNLPNVQIRQGSMTQFPAEKQPYSGIAMIDVMHYFSPDIQLDLARKAHQLLDKGGVLLVREVNPEGGLPSLWNRLYERIATGIGFTQAEKKGLHFRTQAGWEALMKEAGFKVKSEKCSGFLFADILYTCERVN